MKYFTSLSPRVLVFHPYYPVESLLGIHESLDIQVPGTGLGTEKRYKERQFPLLTMPPKMHSAPSILPPLVWK